MHPEVDEAKFGGAMVDMRAEVTETQQRAVALARELGYTDELSIGALEDGIRFWQRRTVEACLELGKRLLLLKEATPHGDFTARLELLGFAKRSAYRFMGAAAKTAKSANLALLAKQVKQQSLFLELVTEDDDVIERIAEIDDVDRMAPTELRKAVRDAKAELLAKDERIAKKQERIEALEDETARIKVRTKDEATEALLIEFAKAEATCTMTVAGTLRPALEAMQADAGDHTLRMAATVAKLIVELETLRDEFGLPTLGAEQIPDWIQAAQGGEA
ncbi:hypothetical protein VITFI_CDS0623 [Vitreoscilla filiformis]|uniref:DUF3102 domain-containing protein n=1 Tax=Vitreoscilla filiformis TaxID=63 RepID=A0A221KBJ9_VITFI|nr:hypothetical protein VITFI_CDS0623 [Vitreoscilla filiformis]